MSENPPNSKQTKSVLDKPPEPNKDKEIDVIDLSDDEICIVDEVKKSNTTSCDKTSDKKPSKKKRQNIKRDLLRAGKRERGSSCFSLNGIPMKFWRKPEELTNQIRKHNPFLDYFVESENRQTKIRVCDRYITNKKKNTFHIKVEMDDFLARDIVKNFYHIKLDEKTKIRVRKLLSMDLLLLLGSYTRISCTLIK